MFSLGQLFLPHRWHEQMQADSHRIVKSLRSETLRWMGAGTKVLDTGSSCQQERTPRGETLAVGAVLHTLDFCPGEGFDFTGDVSALSFEDASYDIVLSTQALDPQKGLLGESACAEARRASVSNPLTSL